VSDPPKVPKAIQPVFAEVVTPKVQRAQSRAQLLSASMVLSDAPQKAATWQTEEFTRNDIKQDHNLPPPVLNAFSHYNTERHEIKAELVNAIQAIKNLKVEMASHGWSQNGFAAMVRVEANRKFACDNDLPGLYRSYRWGGKQERPKSRIDWSYN